MSGSRSDFVQQIHAEYERIGLRAHDHPALVTQVGAEDAFLARLRALPPGSTWRDVFPDMPLHWVPGRPETWTTRYRPLGAFDYQELPTGPVVDVQWPRETDRGCLQALLARAQRAGWRIYGAGFLEVTNPAWRTLDASLVLERGTPEDVLVDFVVWISDQPDVTLAAVPRTGREQYAP